MQGIQSFIFQTNDLKDVIGASELVEQICTTAFKELSGELPNIIGAAGNIKHVFDDEAACRDAVLKFPKKVMEMAPGITISQAVVKLGEAHEFRNAIEKLEENLRTQRNRPSPSMTLGLLGVKRAPKTGLPAVDFNKELMDAATVQKRAALDRRQLCQKCFGVNVADGQFAHNIKDITDVNDWIAVIHADGNGLGQVVQKVGHDKEQYSDFSKRLDYATCAAAQEAFIHVVDPESGSNVIPLRPVLLGGDDLTVIIRADLAVPYTQAFLQAFEQHTREQLGEILTKYNVFNGENCLTACAGIAFIKSSFPFHYGYHLAEALCDRAKKDAKSKGVKSDGGLAPSCLMFHKVQSSYIQRYDDIVTRELQPNSDASWEFGPYYLSEIKRDTEGCIRWSVDELLFLVNKLRQHDSREDGALKNHVRQWMSLMYDSPKQAKQHLERSRSIVKDIGTLDLLTNKEKHIRRTKQDDTVEDFDRFPAYDLLSLLSVMMPITPNTNTQNQQ